MIEVSETKLEGRIEIIDQTIKDHTFYKFIQSHLITILKLNKVQLKLSSAAKSPDIACNVTF